MLFPKTTTPRTASDEIADALRDAINNGEFDDGEELSQVALAKHFGVSRVPIREALRELRAEGLITAKANRQVVVNGLTIARVSEILDIRGLLELHMFKRAMPKLGTEQIERLKQLCREMDATSQHQEWLAKDRLFHQTLSVPADAPYALEMVEQLLRRVGRYLHRWSDVDLERTRRGAGAEHWAIVHALEKGDVSKAQRELKRHVNHTRARIVEEFAKHQESYV